MNPTLYLVAQGGDHFSEAAKVQGNFFNTLDDATKAAIVRRGKTEKKQMVFAIRVAWVGWENGMSYQYEDEEGKPT